MSKSPWEDTPLTRCAAASLPLLIEAHGRMHGIAAPQATRIAERISALLAEIIEVSAEVECYGAKWCESAMSDLSVKLREANYEYNRIG